MFKSLGTKVKVVDLFLQGSLPLCVWQRCGINTCRDICEDSKPPHEVGASVFCENPPFVFVPRLRTIDIHAYTHTHCHSRLYNHFYS